MAVGATDRTLTRPDPTLPIGAVAAEPPGVVLERLASTGSGLTEAEAQDRLRRVGPNAVRSHAARPWTVLARQLRNPLLVLLTGTAVVSFFLGERTDTVVIAVILLASVGLGFVNEYRAEHATQLLHDQVSHRAVVRRDGATTTIDVVGLVPGDVVHLDRGEVVPADLRLLEVTGLVCDEGMLTGESVPIAKSAVPVPDGTPLAELTCCALMGTVVRAGSAVGVVAATGVRTEFGTVAAGLGTRQPQTEFQHGLQRFSVLLLRVAGVLTALILVANLALRRPLIDSVLFSLAIAVGITPQLLPAVVSTSLATGARLLARRRVLVKRLVCIEDLGDMDVLVTDKTGTLTVGRLSLAAALDPAGNEQLDVLRLARRATPPPEPGAALEDPLDEAMWESPLVPAGPAHAGDVLALLPFDHERQRSSALLSADDGSAAATLVVKGAPEAVFARCPDLPPAATAVLDGLFAAGRRVIAVASRAATVTQVLSPADETDLTLTGFLVFTDPVKEGADASLERLRRLGVAVKVCTGDNGVVAEKLCADLGLPVTGSLTGADLAALDDAGLARAAERTAVFSRVTPDQKARLVRALRHSGRGVGFLGDGVNDALALHDADIGISVDGAVDVAKDAADVILLEKDLGVLADGIAEGRRIFANTIKYVLMGTSSNFGNMFSAAAASAVLPFLPMLPSQILLNNLLYDASQLAIPTDRVDPEQLRAPSHWDIAAIRRFMLFFGPLSSLFDFLTFALMLGMFHAGPALFRAGWFAESLATQTLIVFAIRTRRPMVRSRPSAPLSIAAALTVIVGALLPVSPLGPVLGFTAPPLGFYLVLGGLLIGYLGLVEAGKRLFFSEFEPTERQRTAGRTARPAWRPGRRRHHRVQRRASRFSVGERLQHTPSDDGRG